MDYKGNGCIVVDFEKFADYKPTSEDGQFPATGLYDFLETHISDGKPFLFTNFQKSDNVPMPPTYASVTSTADGKLSALLCMTSDETTITAYVFNIDNDDNAEIFSINIQRGA